MVLTNNVKKCLNLRPEEFNKHVKTLSLYEQVALYLEFKATLSNIKHNTNRIKPIK